MRPFRFGVVAAPQSAERWVADVKPGSAMVLSSTQGVYGLRKKLADVLNLDESNVRVQYFEGSGCYGHTAYDDAAQAAAVLSQSVGKPVRLQFMRWDEHGWENYGPAQLTDIRAGVDAKGKIVSYDYSVYAIPYFAMESTQELTGSPIPYIPPLGWVAVLGGVTALALVTTIWPVRRLLRTPPIDNIGIKE